MNHFVYVLLVDSRIFYCGYTGVNLDDRLKQHITAALHPTKRERLNRIIRGGNTPEPNKKDKVILDAIAAGLTVKIIAVETAPVSEELDEQFWISALMNEGIELTNQRKGKQWQL